MAAIDLLRQIDEPLLASVAIASGWKWSTLVGRDGLDHELRRLLRDFRRHGYATQPFRREVRARDDGSPRVLRVPDEGVKVLQRAALAVLRPDIEPQFLDCSYARPGRSQLQAVAQLRRRLERWPRKCVLHLDIERFFDRVQHQSLLMMLRSQLRNDASADRLQAWLTAGAVSPGHGLATGAPISSMLASLYLHVALDRWFAQVVKPNLGFKSQVFRYEDDVVVAVAKDGPEGRARCEELRDRMGERLGEFGLALHRKKTYIAELRKGSSDRLDFLGFTFRYCRDGRRRPHLLVHPSEARIQRALRRAAAWITRNRALPPHDQYQRLRRLVRGFVSYFGATQNRHHIERLASTIADVWLERTGSNPDPVVLILAEQLRALYSSAEE